MLRHAAGLGRLPETQPERTWRTEYRRRHADVLVVGGGRAGLAAAIAAAELGADVVLADEGPEPGGRLLWEDGHNDAQELTAQARAAGVEILCSAPALGHFDGLVPIWQGDTHHQVRAHHHLYATGAIEQPLVFSGNDIPGVMLSGGARRLIALYGVKPGERAVVATTSDRGIRAAFALQQAGVNVLAVADLRTTPTRLASALEKHRDRGPSRLDGGGGGRAPPGSAAPCSSRAGEHAATRSERREFDCDLVIVSGGDAPATALITQAGGRTAYDEQRGYFRITEVPPTVWAAGQVAGEGEHHRAQASGERAGLEVAQALRLGDQRTTARLSELRTRLHA